MVVLAIVALLLPAADSGKVLCFGADGFVQVEDVLGPRCAGYAAAATDEFKAATVEQASPRGRGLSGAHSYGRCVDIPCLESAAAARPRTPAEGFARSADAFVAAAVVIVRVLEFACSGAPSPPRATPPTQSTARLATSALLI